MLHHLREKLPNAEIGVRLGVSPDAVKYHVSNMLGKLQLENREQLAAWSEPSGLRRLWAGTAGMGWKLAIGGGVVAVSVVAVAVVWGLTRDDTEEAQRFDPAALTTGVLTVGIDGEPANGQSWAPSISAEGRFIAFESDATNLVPDDTNDARDIFLLDRLTNETRRISMRMGGAEPNGPSFRPSISADGKWVAFDSQASNLVKDDENGDLDRALPFVPDNMKKLLEPRSDGSEPLKDNAPSWAGSDIFVVELSSGDVELVSLTTDERRGNLGSHAPSISRDGRYVAFESTATNLSGRATARGGPGVGASSFIGFGADIYVRDRDEGTTTLVSRAADDEVWERQFGSGRPAITPDGEYVVFISMDARLVEESQIGHGGVYVWSRQTGKLRSIEFPELDAGEPVQMILVEGAYPAITDNGKTIAFAANVISPGANLDSGGLWIHTEGDAVAMLVPGTEILATGPLPLSFSSSGDILATSAVEGQSGAQNFSGGSIYHVETKQLSPIQLPLGAEGAWIPELSRDGRWIAAVQPGPTLGRGPSGLPISQIVVFAR